MYRARRKRRWRHRRSKRRPDGRDGGGHSHDCEAYLALPALGAPFVALADCRASAAAAAFARASLRCASSSAAAAAFCSAVGPQQLPTARDRACSRRGQSGDTGSGRGARQTWRSAHAAL